MNTSGKQNLNSAFRQVLQVRSESIRMLADRIGLSDSTLRSWLSRNRWPKEAAVMIARTLALAESAEELEEKYYIGREWVLEHAKRRVCIQPDSLRAAFKIADAKCEKMQASMESVTRNIELLCGAMRRGDLRILLTASVTPVEFERHIGDEMRRAIAEGVHNGGMFLYLRPMQILMDEYETVWKFDRFPNEEKCRNEIIVLQEYIENYLVDQKNILRKNARGRAIQSTPQYFVRKDIPFLVPGFTIMMFRAGGYPGSEEDRMMVRLPENKWATVYLPRVDYFRDRFRRCVRMALESEDERLESLRQKLPRGKRRSTQAIALEREQKILTEIRHTIG